MKSYSLWGRGGGEIKDQFEYQSVTQGKIKGRMDLLQLTGCQGWQVELF